MGDVAFPAEPVPDVIDFAYTGNRLHSTQKPVESLNPLISSFCRGGGVVLDPFCGSGSTLVAALELGRAYVGIELKRVHFCTAGVRVLSSQRRAAWSHPQWAACSSRSSTTVSFPHITELRGDELFLQLISSNQIRRIGGKFATCQFAE